MCARARTRAHAVSMRSRVRAARRFDRALSTPFRRRREVVARRKQLPGELAAARLAFLATQQLATDAMHGGVPPACAMRHETSTPEHASSVRRRMTSARSGVDGMRNNPAKARNRRRAAKYQSASSSACFCSGHGRPTRGPERAWERSRSPPAPTRHLKPLRTTLPVTDPGPRTRAPII